LTIDDQITFSNVIGKSRIRLPVALKTAFATAAPTPVIPISPTPRAPKEVNAKADGFAVHLADQRIGSGACGEQARFDVCDTGDDFVLGLFIHREFGDEAENQCGIG